MSTTSADITLAAFEKHMRTRKLSPYTIDKRLALIGRLQRWLAPTELLEASPAQLERFQETFADKARATMDVYSRHVCAFYRWANETDRIAVSPTNRMAVIRVPPGRPHPISEADLRVLLACSRGSLRLAFVLAAFAGLRRGEICRLRVEDLNLDVPQPTALIQGKGGRERIVPFLPPVVSEVRPVAERYGRGAVVRTERGGRYNEQQLTLQVYRLMGELGIASTLHSLRHYFATTVARTTKDVLLVKDLLGHSSLQTTQIYMQSSIDGAQERMAAFTGSAAALLAN